jgi:hypothetical protein
MVVRRRNRLSRYTVWISLYLSVKCAEQVWMMFLVNGASFIYRYITRMAVRQSRQRCRWSPKGSYSYCMHEAHPSSYVRTFNTVVLTFLVRFREHWWCVRILVDLCGCGQPCCHSWSTSFRSFTLLRLDGGGSGDGDDDNDGRRTIAFFKIQCMVVSFLNMWRARGDGMLVPWWDQCWLPLVPPLFHQPSTPRHAAFRLSFSCVWFCAHLCVCSIHTIQTYNSLLYFLPVLVAFSGGNCDHSRGFLRPTDISGCSLCIGSSQKYVCRRCIVKRSHERGERWIICSTRTTTKTTKTGIGLWDKEPPSLKQGAWKLLLVD